MSTFTLNRRTVLRGAGGAGVALPFLEAMLPRRASWAQASIKRYVVCFAGLSLGADNRGKLTDIVPDRVGADYDLKPPMAALADLKSEVSVVSGLRIPVGGAGGRAGGFHKSSISPLLSGTRAQDVGANCYGPTSDVVLANALKPPTRFASLHYRIQAEAYRGGGRSGIISYRGPSQGIDPIASPTIAFNTLFANFAPPNPNDPAQVAARTRLLRDERSVLDLVRASAQRLEARLGAVDKARLGRHFDEIRDLEKRIAAIPLDGKSTVAPAAGCRAPAKPAPDQAAEIVGRGIGYAGEEERAKAMTSILVKAFACDLARIGALMYTHVQCFMNSTFITGVADDCHEISHRAMQPQFMQIWGWHYKHFAGLLTQLRQEIGSDGKPLLDSTVLVLVNEGGLGPGDGKTVAAHSTENMMALVAGGRGLGLKPGRHIKTEGEHPARILTAAMNAAGHPATALGDVSGRLEALYG